MLFMGKKVCYLVRHTHHKGCVLILTLEYGFPMDDQELERMDICHAKYFALLDKRHYLSPIGGEDKPPQRILDIGCGTGNLHNLGLIELIYSREPT